MIACNVGHHIKHLLRAKPNQNGLMERFHRINEMTKMAIKRTSDKAINQKVALGKIADNKKAIFNYFIEERFEAGMVLEGWEVKAARMGKVQITDGFIIIRGGELFMMGCQINPLHTASTHVNPNSVRSKKLLLKKEEIKKLIGKTEQKGYTLVALNMHWKNGKIKCEMALAKGKADHDKRDTIKDREGKREVERAMKSRSR